MDGAEATLQLLWGASQFPQGIPVLSGRVQVVNKLLPQVLEGLVRLSWVRREPAFILNNQDGRYGHHNPRIHPWRPIPNIRLRYHESHRSQDGSNGGSGR